MGVSDLAAASGMPKSGVHRLLQALVEEDYVVRSAEGGYTASIKLWELGSSVLAGLDLRRDADPVMERLMESTGECVHLSVLDGDHVVYLHKVDSPDPVRCYSQIGGRAPAHRVATGKAMMAFKSPMWLRRTLHSMAEAGDLVGSTDAFLDSMGDIRRDGYAVNLGEWRVTVHGVAAPIFDRDASVIAAIGVSGPSSRLDFDRLTQLSEEVCDAARQLSDGVRKKPAHAVLLGVTRHWSVEDAQVSASGME
jgi:DNA-binding IclR family transcriptional regulator